MVEKLRWKIAADSLHSIPWDELLADKGPSDQAELVEQLILTTACERFLQTRLRLDQDGSCIPSQFVVPCVPETNHTADISALEVAVLRIPNGLRGTNARKKRRN